MDRRFTVAEAEALLPLLKVRLEQLQDVQREIEEAWTDLEKGRRRSYRREGTVLYLDHRGVAESRLRARVADANAILLEIRKTGCLVKDVDQGLVDFPARLDGEEVLLCWRLGEPGIRFYHTPDQGYAGRRPLPDSAWKEEGDG